jgi:hypothetical protein
LPNGTNGVKRKRKPAQRGVQAVFTPRTDWKGKAQLALGLVSLTAGAASWAYTSRALGGWGFGNFLPWNPTASALLLPISIPLLIGGVGLSTYYFAMRRTWRASNRIESALYELEALVGQKNGLGESSHGPNVSSGLVPAPAKKARFSLGSSTLGFALAEAIILLVIYGGLVQEYTSNLYMQNWVRANFEPGSYLLSYNAVLALAGILGILIFQLLPRKIRSRNIQRRL